MVDLGRVNSPGFRNDTVRLFEVDIGGYGGSWSRSLGDAMAEAQAPAQVRRPGALIAAVARLSAGRFASPRAVLVGLLSVLVLMLCRIQMVDQWLSLQNVAISMAVTSAAIGVFSAICCAVIGQLHDDARGLWFCVGLMLYSLVGIPAATLTADAGLPEPAFGNVRIVAHSLLVVVTFASVFVVARPRWDGWLPFGLGLAVTAGAAGLGLAFPALSAAVNASQAVRFGVCALWLVSGVSVVVAARTARISWQLWVGLGLTILAAAHTVRVALGSPFDPLGISFSSLRFFGVSLIFFGAAPAARRALVEACRGRMDQLAELTDVRSGLLEAAQRDHEIRNSLNVLTSATTLLNSDVRDLQDQMLLRAAVIDELTRLNVLLSPRGPHGSECPAPDYDVVQVLSQRVALAASTGMDIRLSDVDPSLRAQGNPQVLAQVLANVLANCERHAPGSPVRISAVRRGRSVMLRVCDFGPGVPAALETGIFECGVRGPESPGQGFGLYLCRRLLNAESGQITLKPRELEDAGCTVVVELPIAGPRRAARAEFESQPGLGPPEVGDRPGPNPVRMFSSLRQGAVRV